MSEANKSNYKELFQQYKFRIFIIANVALMWLAILLFMFKGSLFSPSGVHHSPFPWGEGQEQAEMQPLTPEEEKKQFEVAKKEREKQVAELVKQVEKKQDKEAGLELGILYTWGDEYVEKDPYKAAAFMKEGAQDKHGQTLYYLGNLFFAGDFGMQHTFEVAYALWSLALEAGFEEYRHNYDNVLLKIMSEGQKEQGEMLLQQMRLFGVIDALEDYTGVKYEIS